jgi:phytoene synthase
VALAALEARVSGTSAAAALGAFRRSNFAPAFFLLPARRRRALQGVYAFCRAVDDVVDDAVLRAARGAEPSAEFAAARRALDDWRALLRGTLSAEPGPGVDRAVWSALEAALEAAPIDRAHLLDLVDGVGRDLDATRYRTFAELREYCHGVASTVGLACLPVFGLDEPSHRDFAVNLGVAVQLTNILRDVGPDAALDRVYLPLEDLERFGYGADRLKASETGPDFQRLMRFQAARAREFYAAAARALPRTSRRAARPALVMGALYRALLEELERGGFRVFGERARLSFRQKIAGVWSVLREEWKA